MDLSTDFVAYLASLDISVSAYSALNPVDRSAIRRDFNLFISPGGVFGSVGGARGVTMTTLVHSAGRASPGSAVDHINGPSIQPSDSVGLVAPVINTDREDNSSRDRPPTPDAGGDLVASVVSMHSSAPASVPLPSPLWDTGYVVDRPGKVRFLCVYLSGFFFFFELRVLSSFSRARGGA